MPDVNPITHQDGDTSPGALSWRLLVQRGYDGLACCGLAWSPAASHTASIAPSVHGAVKLKDHNCAPPGNPASSQRVAPEEGVKHQSLGPSLVNCNQSRVSNVLTGM
jgi:hypothetical protein